MNTLPTGVYRHIKGNDYYVYGTAIHSESQETMVIYAPVNSNGDLWVRPISLFNETVETDSGVSRRFTFISED